MKITKKMLCLCMVVLLLCGQYVHRGIIVQAADNAVIDFGVEEQVVDGFGVSVPADGYGTQIYNNEKREEIMKLLFTDEEVNGQQGINLSIMRSEIGCGRNLNCIWDIPSLEESAWDKVLNEDTAWLYAKAKGYGVDKFVATVWSPPWWMKTNTAIEGLKGSEGWLYSTCYDVFATYLAEYDKMLKEKYDIDLHAISFMNEPEYASPWQGCRWDGYGITRFTKLLGAKLEEYNSDTGIMAGEKGTWSEDMITGALNDPVASDYLDIVSAHQYWGQIRPMELARSKGKKTWMTELSDHQNAYNGNIEDGTRWAEKVQGFMIDGMVNAFVFWLGAADKDTNEMLIQINGTTDYEVSKRFYGIGHFSRFVRPGYVRVRTNGFPTNGLSWSAYKDPVTGKNVIVIVNKTNYNAKLNFNLQNTTVNAMTPYVTNEDYNMEQLANVPVQYGQLSYSIGAYSYVTLVGDDTTEAVVKEWDTTDNLDNYNQLHARTSNLSIASQNDWNAMNDDSARLYRTALTEENIIYKKQNITDFEIETYHYNHVDGIEIYGSNNGQDWQKIDVANTQPILTGSSWRRSTIYLNEPLTQPIEYVKVVIKGGSIYWDQQIGQVKLIHE